MGNKNIWIPAREVKIGDNVWEHNIVRNIVYEERDLIGHKTGETRCYFNDGDADRWSVREDEIVMVTNR